MNTGSYDLAVMEFPFSHTRHGQQGDGPLCNARSKWTPFRTTGSITCLKCLGILGRREQEAGDGLVECGVCGDHVGATVDGRVLAHRQNTRRRRWCSGYGAVASTLRQVTRKGNQP